ncbi:MAG: hypothetical protein KDE53_18450, partial [Caldilineaceae bacterium]|nr:hypothetical protein [Caldilineaceae bacterium]
MMLGAIDVAASDSVPARALTSPFSARQISTRQTATFQNSSTSDARYSANERQQLVGDEQQPDRSRDPYISSERQRSLASDPLVSDPLASDPLASDRVSDEYAAAQHGEERSSM